MPETTDEAAMARELTPDAIGAALRSDSTYGYTRVGRVVSAIIRSPQSLVRHEPSARELRALLLAVADPDFSISQASVALPSSIAAEYGAGVGRIRAHATSAGDAFFSIGNDLFIKDLAVCLGQLLPAGARLLDVHSGLPRRLLLWQGTDVLSALGFFSLAGGFQPWFETHVDPRDLSEFSEAGLVRMYLRVAALLEANPQVLGVFGGSWFYDPVLETLSPHLAYLRKMPQQHGARLLRGVTTPGSVRSALLKSKRRREAHERGTYRPQNYFLAWPRRALLNWAQMQHTSPALPA